ncbi:RNA-directed DNA polymerase from mobile element jockey [Trichonephila clavipes]|nr:RNA-directed DNA polymerase from mobile element jockey [Trichonephila clavipes]
MLQGRTGGCPIKERIENPECINCKEKGHMANWRTCKAFPQIKSKKGAAAENRNGKNKSQPKSFDSKRNKARTIYQHIRHPSDKSILNRLQHKIHRKVRDFTQNQWEETLTSPVIDGGSLWGLARSFRKKRSPIPTLKGHTPIAYSNAEKAETLADSLKNLFKLTDISNPQHDKNHTRLVSRFFPNDNNFDENPTNPKFSENLTNINKLKIRKAPGREGIFNKRWFETLINPLSLELLTLYIENILKLGYFSQAWQTASVIPILKPGKDPTLPEFFRPISLLLILSKLAEKIILNRLCLHLNTNVNLIPQQHGFRAELSTSHQLLRVEYIKTGFKYRKLTGKNN